MKIAAHQIVMSPGWMKHSVDTLAFSRRYLLHVINPETGRCHCGRNADMWDMPYIGRGVLPTLDEILQDDKSFCRQCRRSLDKNREKGKK